MWRVLERRRPHQKHVLAQKCNALILGEQNFADIKNTFQRMRRCHQRSNEGGTVGKYRLAGVVSLFALTGKTVLKFGARMTRPRLLESLARRYPVCSGRCAFMLAHLPKHPRQEALECARCEVAILFVSAT